MIKPKTLNLETDDLEKVKPILKLKDTNLSAWVRYKIRELLKQEVKP